MNKQDLIKYYRYPHTNRVTKQKNTNNITGCGMIVRLPMSPDDMDKAIEKSLKE